MTSSPTWPTTLRPDSFQASAATPSERAWISPAYTGRVGTPPTKPVQQSVPPLPVAIDRSALTFS
jgi:hypothetical protein